MLSPGAKDDVLSPDVKGKGYHHPVSKSMCYHPVSKVKGRYHPVLNVRDVITRCQR